MKLEIGNVLVHNKIPLTVLGETDKYYILTQMGNYIYIFKKAQYLFEKISKKNFSGFYETNDGKIFYIYNRTELVEWHPYEIPLTNGVVRPFSALRPRGKNPISLSSLKKIDIKNDKRFSYLLSLKPKYDTGQHILFKNCQGEIEIGEIEDFGYGPNGFVYDMKQGPIDIKERNIIKLTDETKVNSFTLKNVPYNFIVQNKDIELPDGPFKDSFCETVDYVRRLMYKDGI